MTGPLLVTGAGGVIGRQLVTRLLHDGFRVRAFVRRDPAAPWSSDPRVEVVRGDLGDAAAVERAVAGTSVVCHVGATMHGSAADFDRGTIAGTRHVVDSVLRHGVPKLVYMSSLSVLHAAAARAGVAITEHWPLEPRPEARGHYTRAKLVAEGIVTNAAREQGLRVVVIRPAEVVGPGAPLLSSGVAQRVGHTLVILGDGRLPVPLVAVDDLLEALMTAIGTGPFDGTVVHLVDPTPITQNDLAARYTTAVGGRWRLVRVPRALAVAAATTAELAFGLLRRTAPLTRYRLASALAPRTFDCERARQLWAWHPRAGVLAALDALARGLAS